MREALGGGSYTTIAPALRAWREAHAESAELAELDVPDEVATALSEVGARVWRAARREAERGHNEMRQALAAADARAAQVEAEHAEAIETVELERDEAQAGLASAEARASQAEAEVVRLRQAVERADAARAAAEEARGTAAVALATAEAQVEGLRDRVADQRETISQLTARVSVDTSRDGSRA